MGGGHKQLLKGARSSCPPRSDGTEEGVADNPNLTPKRVSFLPFLKNSGSGQGHPQGEGARGHLLLLEIKMSSIFYV